MATLINATLFQLTWFSCVMGGAVQQPWWGVLSLSCLLVFSARREHIRPDILLALVLVIVGWSLETLWIDNGILIYGAGQNLVPIWIPLLWAGVALTVNHSLAWFQRYPLCGAAMAALAAPLTYLSGEQLGAVVAPEPLLMIWISLAWFVVFFLVFRLMPEVLARQRPLVAAEQ